MSEEPQNPISEQNSLPSSPQEPMGDSPIPTPVSTPAEAPLGATEPSMTGFPAESTNIAPSNPTPIGGSGEARTEDNQAETESSEADKPTAQSGRNEPLGESSRSRVLELLDKAKNAIQFRKRKKLDKIMVLFLHQSKITNDEVEKYLHVSDATATRYLSQLEKEGKIKQNSKTGHMVSYSRI